jgi:hypothetical protein
MPGALQRLHRRVHGNMAEAGRRACVNKEIDMALITFTHTIGCDAEEIARRVAEGLGVEVYDDAKLREEALRMGLHADWM